MKFCTLDEAGEIPYRATFRDARLIKAIIGIAVLYVLLLAILIGGKDWLELPGGNRTIGFLALGLFAVAVGGASLCAALTYRPANWVLRVTPEAVLVNLARFGAVRKARSGASVLVLAPGEIAGAGAEEGGRSLYLTLPAGEHRDVDAAIEEHGGIDPPVRLLAGGSLLVRWRMKGTWVLPGIEAAVEELTRATAKPPPPPARRAGTPRPVGPRGPGGGPRASGQERPS